MNFGLQVSLLGFSTVLITLFMLYRVLLLFTRLFTRVLPGKGVPLPGAGDDAAGKGISPEMVAALGAAVFRYLELTGIHGKLTAITVEREKELPGNSWAAAGRRLMMEWKLEHERLRRKKNR